METAQIVQSLRQQEIQQNGISSGISRMLGSGFSFSDIILTMLSNTGLGGDLQNEKAIPSQYGEIIDILSENLMSGETQFPVIPQENGDIDLKNSDFFGNLISVDPSRLSGLLGFVMTGRDTLRNSGQLSSLYEEMPVKPNGLNADGIAASELINEYIESGELEIIGYKSGSEGGAEAFAGKDSASDSQDESGLLDFYRTMQNAKEAVPAVKDSEKTKSSGLGAMQNDAQGLDIRFDRITSDIRMKTEFEAPEKQLLKGVEENLKNGKSEFTVKLKPEGLGEIIVRLVQNDGGKMLMSMTASSAKTAELLNSNLSSLQSSLNQHNVEIVNPSDMIKNAVAPAAPSFEQYYGQNSGNQPQNEQFYNQNKGYIIYGRTDSADVFEEKASAPVGREGLDIII